MPSPAERAADDPASRTAPASREIRSAGRLAPAGLLAFAIALGTLLPASCFAPPVGDPPPRLDLELSLADFLANLLLFLPFGAALQRGVGRLRTVVLTSLLFSGAIELVQLAIPSRMTSPFDVLANVAGAVLGGWLWSARRRLRRPGRVAAGRAGMALAFALTAGLPLAGWLSLAAPPSGEYFLHAPPEIDGFQPLRGEILGVTLDGAALARNPLADSPRARAALAGDFDLRLRLRLDARPTRPSALFMLSAEPGQELVLLLLASEDLVLRQRARTAWLTLAPVEHRAAGLLRSAPLGEPFEIAIRRAGARTCLALADDSRCDGALDVGETWALLLPQLEAAVGRSRLVTGAWIASWAILLGWLAPVSRAAALSALPPLGAVLVTPLLGPLEPLPFWGLAVGALGYATAAALSRAYSE